MELSSGQYQLLRLEHVVGTRINNGEEQKKVKTTSTIVETLEAIGTWWQEGFVI